MTNSAPTEMTDHGPDFLTVHICVGSAIGLLPKRQNYVPASDGIPILCQSHQRRDTP